MKIQVQKMRPILAIALLVCFQSKSVAQTRPVEIRCSEPLPIFTLGLNSKPSRDQQVSLCECIWQKLGAWERKASEAIRNGKEAELTYVQRNGFPSRFGSAFESCGGKSL